MAVNDLDDMVDASERASKPHFEHDSDLEAGPESEPGQSELVQSGYDAGLRALVGREHSTLELKRKLIRKGHSPDVVDAVVDRLQQDGALSDERFVDVFVRSRIQRGDGPIKIRLALSERGIFDRTATEALESSGVDTGVGWHLEMRLDVWHSGWSSGWIHLVKPLIGSL